MVLGALGLLLPGVGWIMNLWIKSTITSALAPIEARLAAIETLQHTVRERLESAVGSMNHTISGNVERFMRDLWEERRPRGWGGDDS